MWYRETLEIVRTRNAVREAAAAGHLEEARAALTHLRKFASADPQAFDLRRECDRWTICLSPARDQAPDTQAA